MLVVDDEPQARELFCAIVEQAGGEVRVAGSVADAMPVLRSWTPDVLLCDIEMPREDGYALMQRLSAQVDDGAGPVPIAVTAHSRLEDRLRALEAGFSWLVPKPVEPDELVRVIASLARRKRANA